MDDFFRIPKSLCYFMTRKSTTDGNENDAKVKYINAREANIPATSAIPEATIQYTSETEIPAIQESLAKTKKKKSKKILHPRETIKSETFLTRVKNADDSIFDDMDDVPLDKRETKIKKKPKSSKNRQSALYECGTCSRSFARKRQYKIHMVKHSTVRSHKCDVCEKAFKRKSELNSHMQIHSGIKYNCDECNFVTSSKMCVRTHVRRMHQRDFRYKCDECEKSFMSNCELKDHKTSHLGTKSFICEICGKAYLQKSYLVAHKRGVHGVVQKILKKDHLCTICNKSFASEYILRNHAGVHSRKFLCTQCGKEFATNYGLQLHSRQHTGERPHQCKHCSKSFVRSNALAVHELTHSGKRPYVCDLCGKSFTQRTTMMVHRKKHPGTHPPPPPTLLSRLQATAESYS